MPLDPLVLHECVLHTLSHNLASCFWQSPDSMPDQTKIVSNAHVLRCGMHAMHVEQ